MILTPSKKHGTKMFAVKSKVINKYIFLKYTREKAAKNELFFLKNIIIK